jgi:uncharacterized protein
MYVLFSPSESKRTLAYNSPFRFDSFLFPHLYLNRLHVIQRYDSILSSQDSTQKKIWLGLQKETHLEVLSESVFAQPTLPAIIRYNGVAYKYLAYESLPEISQRYVDKTTIIFSNLFGPIRASDPLPYYKLKQGQVLDNFRTESFYKEHFSSCLDSLLEDDCVLDFRSEFYKKFYTLRIPHVTMKFIKNNRVISHFSKAYRGEILRTLALKGIQTKQDLMCISFTGLKLLEVQTQRLQTLLIFHVEKP